MKEDLARTATPMTTPSLKRMLAVVCALLLSFTLVLPSTLAFAVDNDIATEADPVVLTINIQEGETGTPVPVKIFTASELSELQDIKYANRQAVLARAHPTGWRVYASQNGVKLKTLLASAGITLAAGQSIAVGGTNAEGVFEKGFTHTYEAMQENKWFYPYTGPESQDLDGKVEVEPFLAIEGGSADVTGTAAQAVQTAIDSNQDKMRVLVGLGESFYLAQDAPGARLIYNVNTLTVIVPPIPTKIFNGSNRQETAAKLAVEAYPNGTTGVIIANGEGSGPTGKFPDALAATALAGLLGYPVVLTTADTIPDATIKALNIFASATTKPTEIIILGDDKTISEKQKTALAAYGTVNRLSGKNRIETAVAIYKYGVGKNGGWAKTAIFADAGNFPDALAIAPFAANKHYPIFLVQGDALGSTVTNVFNSTNFTDAIIVGSNKSVSDKIATQIKGIIGKAATRLEGANRYKTASAIAKFSVQNGMQYHGAGIATGENFPDALAGGPLLGLNNSVILLTSPADTSTLDLLDAVVDKTKITKLRVFGGEDKVSKAVRNKAAAKLGWAV